MILAASWQNQQSDYATSEDSDQPGHPPSVIRVFAVRMKKAWVLSYSLSAQRRLWSDLADAQADLSLRWAHSHFVGFVRSRLICHKIMWIFDWISPLFRLRHLTHKGHCEQNISGEPLELGSWYLAYRLNCVQCARWPGNTVNIWLNSAPFSILAFCIVKYGKITSRNGQEWCLEIPWGQRKTGKGIVATASVVPRRPPRLRDWDEMRWDSIK